MIINKLTGLPTKNKNKITNTNTDDKGKLFVTVFAEDTPCCLDKNCDMVACRPDYFSAKVPLFLPAAGVTNVYCHNRRAAKANACHN